MMLEKTRVSILNRFMQRVNAGHITAGWVSIVFISMGISLYLTQIHAERLAYSQASTIFEQLVLIRAWNASHGGVYVPETEATPSNPYLHHPRKDVVTTDGQKLTMINPAYMSRQISEIATDTEGVHFHMTSLDPIRPQNAPDEWERKALESFERGETWFGGFLEREEAYRYMAPLKVTKACLMCHAQQGYSEGDIRGGISVIQPVGDIMLARNHSIIATVTAHAVTLIFGLIGLISYRNNFERTQQIRADKEAADQANKLKSDFIANASHELRTPLNTILGTSRLLCESELNAFQQDSIKRISKASEQLNMLVNGMLDFSLLDSGGVKPVLAPMHIRSELQDVVDMMCPKAEQKKLSLEMNICELLPEWLKTDAEYLRHVLINVLDNAIKFTRSGGVFIAVTSQRVNHRLYNVLITIEDTGIGIENAAKLMEQKLMQLDTSRTRSFDGIGLGLTISRELMHLMQGTIEIESEPGVGTTVYLRLPMETVSNPPGVDDSAGTECPANSDVGYEATKEIESAVLDEQQRMQLKKQLGELVAAIDTDYSKAIDLVATMTTKYKSSQYWKELQELSGRVAEFDVDAVIKHCESLQKKLQVHG